MVKNNFTSGLVSAAIPGHCTQCNTTLLFAAGHVGFLSDCVGCGAQGRVFVKAPKDCVDMVGADRFSTNVARSAAMLVARALEVNLTAWFVGASFRQFVSGVIDHPDATDRELVDVCLAFAAGDRFTEWGTIAAGPFSHWLMGTTGLDISLSGGCVDSVTVRFSLFGVACSMQADGDSYVTIEAWDELGRVGASLYAPTLAGVLFSKGFGFGGSND